MTIINPEHYDYKVEWSDEDKLFIGRVSEFPMLAAHGETEEKALTEIKSVVSFVIDDMVENEEIVPFPNSYPKCRKCQEVYTPSKALVNNHVTYSDDFGGDAGQTGTTCSPDFTRADLIKCWKCSGCGHSFTIGDKQ